MKTNNVEDKDIKATSASFNPKYEYKRAICPQVPAADGMMVAPTTYYCGEGKNVLVGYEAYESITVKVRNADDAGKIIQGLGGLGVTNVDGPNFAIDNEDELKAQARKQAIDQAQEKARVLAEDLGVKLGKIVSFEDGIYPGPMYYEKSMDMMVGNAVAQSAPAELPRGENTITSDVTITYEIK